MPIRCNIQQQARPASGGLRTGYQEAKPAPFGTDSSAKAQRNDTRAAPTSRNVLAGNYPQAAPVPTKRFASRGGGDVAPSPFAKETDDFKAMKGGSLGRKQSDLSKLQAARSKAEMASGASAGPATNSNSLHASTKPSNRRHSSQMQPRDTTVGATCRVASHANGSAVCFIRE
eukprot:TRINITY_DN1898_c0_g1_i1.p1 TRINITY_DN1898_c0_g1~~TRINITY_DN1898_c0_g1_i1.p1  ORF type:complete len:198 (+),score=41.93 TRINITY_DN1898_c0_g1_i1:77-595(+)